MSNQIVNMNLETGIRFGVISSNSINADIFADIFDIAWDIFSDECFKKAEKEYMESDCEPVEYDEFCQDFYDTFEPDEIEGDFEYEGIKGHLTTLGGAYILFIAYSPHLTKARLCSPCCPNACDLDSLDENGFECYDVPLEWRELD